VDEKGTKEIRDQVRRLQPTKKPVAGEPDDKLIAWADGLIGKQYYPLGSNLSRIPGKADPKKGAKPGEISAAEARKREKDLLVDERKAFVTESFTKQSFSVMKLENEFSPPPPVDRDVFIQKWLMGDEGQDVKIDLEFEKLMNERPIDKFPTDTKYMVVYQAAPAPGGSPQWLLDGRCSGYVATEEDRQLVYKRLVLRRLVLRAVARAKAPTLRPEGDTYAKPAEVVRGVDKVLELKWLNHDEYLALRSSRYVSSNLAPPQKEPVPYQILGIEMRVQCQLAVAPALLGELENIGRVENRPFAFWAECVFIERPHGKPEWKPGAVFDMPKTLPYDYGYRYREWPVEVFIRGVVPQFDAEKLAKDDVAGV
jgi:hypothetical protein